MSINLLSTKELTVSRPGLLAGVDVGTTSVKVVLMTPEGQDVAVGRAGTRWAGGVGGSEAVPEHFRSSAAQALRDAVQAAPAGSRVVGIGVAGMAESGVLVDRADEPLTDVIAWHDARDEAQLADLARELGADRFSTTTGLPLWTQWSLTKHRWLRDNVPGLERAVRRYNIPEWVARGLGADPVGELSLASRTGWLDLETATPWDAALDWSGAPRALLGDLVRAGDPVGVVPDDHPLAALRGATITIAGHDHQAAVVGAGATGQDDELDSCGTAEALVRTVAPTVPPAARLRLARAGVTIGRHVLRDRWCVLGATQGGLVLQRVLTRLGVTRAGLPDLDRAALAAPAGRSVVTLPDAGHAVDVTGSDRDADVWRAAAVAVTAQIGELSDAISAATAPRADLVVVGGWANSAMVLAAKRDRLGDFRRTTVAEAGARGAALLAGLACGVYPDHAAFPPPPGAPTSQETP